VLEKLVNRKVIAPHDKVVCVSTANGLKFTEFKVKYHEQALEGVLPRQSNPPVMLDADFGQVVDAINRRFG
jgi:threonine synthase